MIRVLYKKKSILGLIITIMIVFTLGTATLASAKTSTKKIIKKSTTTTQATSKKSISYKNIKLGFSINFPSNWKGNYRIQAKSNGITVYFKAKNKKSSGQGMLFTIVKETKSLNEDALDTIPGKRYFKAKGITYVIGGPTDVNFSGVNSDNKTFSRMNSERSKVLKTLKTIK